MRPKLAEYEKLCGELGHAPAVVAQVWLCHQPGVTAPIVGARTFVGRYEPVVGVNSLSKSYGLSGLRIGWAVGSPWVVEQLWRRHEYAAIATGKLDNLLATVALEADVSERLLARNRTATRAGWELLATWLGDLDGLVTAHRPAATPLAFLRVRTALDSVEVGHRIRAGASSLVCPGVYFGCEGYLRMNLGFGAAYVEAALGAMTSVIRTLAEMEAR